MWLGVQEAVLDLGRVEVQCSLLLDQMLYLPFYIHTMRRVSKAATHVKYG